MMLLLSPLPIGIFLQIQNTSAGAVDHDGSNLKINILTDYGRILYPLDWFGAQTIQDIYTTLAFIGLVVDHDNYNHAPGVEDIADCFNTYPYLDMDDFEVVEPLTMVIDDGTLQKSIAAFQNTGVGTGYPNDILINQTCWTVKNKDWAILQWTLTNIKSPASDLTNVRIGLEVPISKEGGRFGLGGNLDDSGDDIDGYDATNDVYWARDLGDDTTIGFASAIVTDPITHYYAEDYYAEYQNPSDPYDPNPKYYKNFFGNDTWLYQRISAPSQTATNGVTPGNITSTVGWDGLDILAGESRTVTLVIAINNSFNNMITAIEDAQYYYRTVVTGFQITEIRDSGSASARIEVYNNGREPTDPVGLLDFTSNVGPLTGTWSVTPIPTYGYSVFSVTSGIIGIEGDTIILRENGVSIDPISFGQEGVAPDPLDGESTARYWDSSIAGYNNDWTREETPTFGAQNDVPPINKTSFIILNEVMFNPILNPDGKYVVLINRNPNFGVNISNYYLVCDDVYQLPLFSLTPGGFDGKLNPLEKIIIKYGDDSPVSDNFFHSIDSSGDNVYLYDTNGRLLDMVGWNTPHISGMSVRRVPDGNGTYQGYNDLTSMAAGWVFNSPFQVLVTEISDDDSTPPQIEVYNPWYPTIDFSDPSYIFESNSGLITGHWIISTAEGGQYALFQVIGGTLDSEGDVLSFKQNSILVDNVPYGQYGVVPDPLSAESVERYWDGISYTNVWERNWISGSNFGFQNDVPPANFSSAVLLNEILFYPNVIADGFVELFLRYGILDISGYKIIGDSEFIIPQGTVLDSNNPFLYFTYPIDPSFFNHLNPSGDNIYLYDDNGSLLDMAGWSSFHNQGKSMRRIPDGNGTRDGYDDTSSMAAGWVFDCIPTPAPTPPPLPAPPTGLHAKLVSKGKDVMLFWNASADDGKGENDVVGYSVYKSSTGVNGSYICEAWIPANGFLSYNWTDINAGDGDWNDYFYIVRANDTLDNEEQNKNKAGKFVNYLVVDWNLISVPLIQTNTSKEYVLQTIEGNYITIQGYHAGKSRPWLHWHKPKPHHFNDVIEINHKNGYYIDMLNPDYLIVAGKVPTNTQISLKTGWNLIGYPCLINKTRDDALSSITGKFNMVLYYDTVKDREVRLGPNDYMKPGLGYWIHVIEDCVIIM